MNKYKNYSLTLLVSLLFFPLVFIGQIGGNILGELFVWFNNTFSIFEIPRFIARVTTSFIAGMAAGYFSALVIKKIYKNLNHIVAMILPGLLIAVAMFGDLSYAIKNGFDLDYLGHVIRNPVSIFYYYYFLNEL